MGKILNYKPDKRIIFALLIVVFLTFLVYDKYFDILIPNLPNDSYQFVVGEIFLIPIIILIFGQVVIGGFFLHTISKSINSRKSDFLRALLITAVMTLLFSLTYMFFPKYGPFYFAVFLYDTSPWYTFPLGVAWALVALTANTYLTKKLIGLSYKFSFLAVLLVYIFIVVGAS